MSLATLPVELIDLIAASCRQHDLLNLSLVSRLWYAPARKYFAWEVTSPYSLLALVGHLHEHPTLFDSIRIFKFEPKAEYAGPKALAGRDLKLVLKSLLAIARNCKQLRFFKSTTLPTRDSQYHDQFWAALSAQTHLDDVQLGDHSHQLSTESLGELLASYKRLTRLKVRVEVPKDVDEFGEERPLAPLAVCQVTSLTLVLTGELSNARLLRLADATFARTHSLVLDLTKSGTITPEGIKDAMTRLPSSLHRLGFYAPKIFPTTVPAILAEMFPRIQSCNLDARRDEPAALDALPQSVVRLRVDTGHKKTDGMLAFLDKLIDLLKNEKLLRLELLRLGCRTAVEESRVKTIEAECKRLRLQLNWLEGNEPTQPAPTRP